MPAAVEEMVRHRITTQALPRTATARVELHGTTIPEGSRVMLLLGTANLDEREFPDPERFDIHRQAAGISASGTASISASGACSPASSSRVAFEELLARCRSTS